VSADPRKTSLDLRRDFRAHGKETLAAYVAAVRAGASSPPRKFGSGPAGGKIPAAVAKLRPKVKRFGYVLPVHLVGEQLARLNGRPVSDAKRPAYMIHTWWVRGASRPGSRQPGRGPRQVEVDDAVLAARLEASVQRQISAWDRQAGGVA
jgi:hypothetical protein